MKYKEFREYLKRNGISLKEDEESLIAAQLFEISKIEEQRIVFLMDLVNFPYEFDLIKKVIELAETPLDKRVEVKKYYLKHKFIKNWGNDNYVNYSREDFIILRDQLEGPNYQTKFTIAEIEELKVEFDTDFNDFEIIEVKED